MVGFSTTLSTVFRPTNNKILLFVLPVFFITIADSVMAFVFPIAVVDSLGSNTLLGAIMAVSAIAGIIFDAVMPVIFGHTKWITKLIFGIIVAGVFPVTTYLGYEYRSIVFFLIATIVWGIYYELMSFSVHEFILSHSVKKTFTYYWGVISAILTITTVIGPIIGGFFYSFSITYLTYAVLISLTFSFILSFIIIQKEKDKKSKTYEHVSYLNTFRKEIRIWKILARSATTVFIVGLLSSLIDSMFWTIGGLYSIELFKGDEKYNYIVIVAATCAYILGHYLVAKSKISSHKKQYANYLLVSGSIFLVMLSFVQSILIIILFVFVANVCLAGARSLNDAVASDIAIRLHGNYEYLISLIRLQVCLAYVLGPLMVGILSDWYGYSLTIRIVGTLSLFTAGLLVILTPKKIRIPQKKINGGPEGI